MSEQRPQPLVPAEVDLRDFAFMPLDVVRLRDSDLAAEETPEACWAAVLLWCASWHQVPAASIPDSDQWQAKQAGYVARGRIDKGWEAVREGALRGWVKCSDGRLYHPVVAEKARTAWTEKQAQRTRTAAATAAREAKRKAEQAARDAQRHGERDEQRDVARDDQRDVHQGRVKGQGQGQGQGLEREGERVSAAPAGSAPPQVPPATPSPRPAARGSRLPAAWTPGEEQREFARSLGLVNGRYDTELAKFRDHWAAQPGQKGVKADWIATWRNWLRRASESLPASARPAGPGRHSGPTGDIWDGVQR